MTSENKRPGRARTLSIVNQKGGVGKTTTAINLAASLAVAGHRTLLIDCDPQANATGGLGHRSIRNSDRITIYEVLLGSAAIRDATLPTEVPHLFLLPGSRNMIGANLELVGDERREYRLKESLQAVLESYEYILLDCPPALDLLTLNALVASDRILVPLQAEYFALEGVSELMSTLERVSEMFNPGLALEGVLLTMYDDRTNLSQQVTQSLRDFFGAKLFETTIPRNIRLAEAPSHGLPVVLYDPKSRGAEAYRALADEFLRRQEAEVSE